MSEQPSKHPDWQQQAEQPDISLWAEFWDFLRYNKKWWLLPIVVLLGLVGLLVFLSSSVVAPFIYPLF
ncbi:MAG: hypothetical protein KatS3mg113_1127 [Planctomycetaceae bacterium]|nr:MAG: hypothetical protein KatS3mg113_1127 [Planctomycetaceae bacterium]